MKKNSPDIWPKPTISRPCVSEPAYPPILESDLDENDTSIGSDSVFSPGGSSRGSWSVFPDTGNNTFRSVMTSSVLKSTDLSTDVSMFSFDSENMEENVIVTHYVSVRPVGGSLNGKAAKVYLVSCGFEPRPLKTLFGGRAKKEVRFDFVTKMYELGARVILKKMGSKFWSLILISTLKNQIVSHQTQNLGKWASVLNIACIKIVLTRALHR